MAGHSKWAQIKRQKGLKDVQRGAIFAKLSRHIMIAIEQGGGEVDPNVNVRLRLAIEKAKQSNMPKDTIERVILKATGHDRTQLKQLYYEVFGPDGVVLYIEALSDNENRTISEIKNVLHRHKAKLGAVGSVAYLFRHCVVITASLKDNDEQEVLRLAESLSAYDIEVSDNNYIITIPFNNSGKIAAKQGSVIVSSQELQFIPQSYVVVPANEHENVMKLIEALEELDDVNAVYTNAEFEDKT